MQTATIREVQHNLARFIRLVETGEEVQILRRDKPVARLTPVEPPPGANVNLSARRDTRSSTARRSVASRSATSSRRVAETGDGRLPRHECAGQALAFVCHFRPDFGRSQAQFADFRFICGDK